MYVEFPKEAGNLSGELMKKYYDMYYTYVLRLLQYSNCNIRLINDTSVAGGAFKVKINGSWVVFDFTDQRSIFDAYHDIKVLAYFKFHYTKMHKDLKKVFPFPPVSFTDWDQYDELTKEIKFTAATNKVGFRQKPYGNARIRRAGVRSVLQNLAEKEDLQLCVGIKSQIEYWKDINNLLVAVFVPGCRNDILDRGHLQYMSFGCCTISPKINIYLPFGKKLVPDKHYIECRPDYLDIADKVKWCKENKSDCLKIGENAKNLFIQTCTPRVARIWIERCIESR